MHLFERERRENLSIEKIRAIISRLPRRMIIRSLLEYIHNDVRTILNRALIRIYLQ